MPNLFAYFMLCAWPVISFFFYRRFDTVTATFLTIVGGYLVLPVKTNIDFPLIPAFDKQSIPAISAFVGCVFIHKVKLTLLPKDKIAKILVIALLVVPFFTVVTNGEPFFNGAYWIQGMSLYDTISGIMRQYLLLLPLILASQIFTKKEDLLLLCKLMVLSGLFYSLFIMVEVRLSPQLHTWIYGFFPHSFAQQMRMGGFRPVVFLGHGLTVAIYMFACFACACVLWKSKMRVVKSIPPWVVMVYLLFILLACKSVGTLVFGGALLSLVLLNNVRLMRVCTNFILVIVIFYPALCMFNLFPHKKLIEFFMGINPDRAGSLAFRFYNEGLLLQHAQEKILFGWGAWGRNRFVDSVSDGRWIIEFGQFGVFGFFSLFCLAIYAIVKCFDKSKGFKSDDNHQKNIVIFTLACSFLMVDQLLNDSLASWVWFLIGSCFISCNVLDTKDKAKRESQFIENQKKL